MPRGVLYADAFFEISEQCFGLFCLNSHPFNGIQNPGQYRNGWGFVVLTGSGFRFGSGCVPAEVGRLFSSRKLRTAYTSLYML